MLLCFTASHRTADFELLERLERHADDVDSALREHTDAFAGSVVLATCNRFETYLDVTDAARADASALVLDTVSTITGVPADELEASTVVVHENAVADHLFSVASGLESLVIGEGEIAGQVRRSLEKARANGSATRELERLFQNASRVSRDVKNGTKVGSAGRSIVRLALELAESRIADWASARILLVGTGNYAAASLKALRDRGAQEVRVWSRTGRAGAFAIKHDIEAVDRDGLVEAIATSQLVVTCSVAPTVLLDRELVERASRLDDAVVHRLIVDLGLPRNVDSDVAWVTGTELLDLETIGLHAPLEDFKATERARSIVNGAAAEFAAKGDERAAEPALVALRSHVLGLVDAEIERARARGDSSQQTEAALRHLAGVLLHTPSLQARELSRDGDADTFVAGVNAVFGLDSEAAPGLRIVADEGRAS
ncbi:glutamyl-tRNA reductase [Humibacter sp. RRB41]|uniref:glutamyl-tRNA reductase n=1 Tax=Humibacter sp. RRB41 TaxID=2919946 RepID=UPI001FA9F5A5|nr:glutamyl-tRNA reductase [Humibacter sp. RRB41]